MLTALCLLVIVWLIIFWVFSKHTFLNWFLSSFVWIVFLNVILHNILLLNFVGFHDIVFLKHSMLRCVDTLKVSFLLFHKNMSVIFFYRHDSIVTVLYVMNK